MPKKVLYETTAPKMNFRKISDASILFEPNDLKSGKKTVYSQILLPDEDTIRRLSIPKNIQFENLNFNKNANSVSKSRFLKNSDRVPVSFNQPANINLSPVIDNADLAKNSLLLKNSDRVPVLFNQPANINLSPVIENADLVKNSLLLKNSDRMPVSFNQPANIRSQVIDNVRNFKRQGYNCPSLLWLTILAVIILLLQLLFIYLFCKFKI
jgi:hypothetical protein